MMKVKKEQCAECLFGPNPIVPPSRKDQLLRKLKREDSHFICHKSPEGEKHTCHASYQMMPQLVRIAGRLNALEFVD
jgi:hypothetical protein